MRNGVVKSSRVLLTLAGIGILSIMIGILYFSGVASWVEPISSGFLVNRLFFGFNHQILFAYGFFLFVVGVFPVLSAADINARKLIRKFSVHLLGLFSIGILLFVYSVFVYLERLELFDPLQSWFEYSIIAGLLVTFSLPTLLFSIQNRERVWNLKILFILLLIVGLLASVASLLLYGGYIDLQERITWDFLFILAVMVISLGVIPLMLSASPNFRGFLHRLKYLWLILCLIGFLVIVVAGLVNFEILESSLVLDFEWDVLYLFGGLILFISLLFLAGAREIHKTLNKLRYLWIISFLIGFILVIFSFIAILPTSPQFSDIVGDLDLEMYFDISYMYGIALTILSLIFICSIVYFETEELADGAGISAVSDLLSESETTTSEMLTYLEIVQKSNEKIIENFKEALREDKFRPRVFEKLIKRYQDGNRALLARIDKYRGKSPFLGREEASTLFEEAIGTETVESAEAPTIPPPTPPKTIPSGPPMPPKTPPSGPPIPSVPPPTPVGIPSTPPPAPGVIPAKSPQSPLDLIADARSTSIAELRGEMLKELRRLREIFKEE